MYSLPSAETSHFSASSGSTSVLPDLYFTRPSYMAVVAMKPSWASIAGGSRRLVSLPHRKVSVLAAVAPGFDAGAVVAAAAAGAVVGLAAAAGAVVAAAAGAVVAAAAGGVVGLGAAAGAVVGAAAGAAGPHAASRPMPAAILASFKTRRRVGIFPRTSGDQLPRRLARRSQTSEIRYQTIRAVTLGEVAMS